MTSLEITKHIPFIKMHSNGNDFVIIDERQQGIVPPLMAKEIQRLADRHRGVGCDQVLVLSPSTHPEAQKKNIKAQVRIFNGDGSPAMACGNGMRCVGAFLAKAEGGQAHQEIFLQGPMEILKAVCEVDGHVTLEMDTPIVVQFLDQDLRPVHAFKVEGLLPIVLVMVGNPHVVVFCQHLDVDEFSSWAPQLACSATLERAFQKKPSSALLAGGYNVHAVACEGPQEARQLIWERGVGMTASCGTGAGAVAVAGVAAGLMTAPHITVHQPGGAIDVFWNREHLITRGPSVHVFSGVWTRNEK